MCPTTQPRRKKNMPEVQGPIESIRFGSTVESARAIAAWMLEKDPTTAVRLELSNATIKLIVFTSSTDNILNTGDYLVYEDGYFVKYEEAAFAEAYGPGLTIPLEGENLAGGLEEVPTEE